MQAQRGISALGLLFLLILGGFVVLCLLRIGPLYYGNYKMDQIFERVATEGVPIETQTTSEIRKRISAQFGVDGIRDISANDIDIERDKGDVTLVYAHEDRVSLIGNLDVVAVFENRISTADELEDD